MGVGIIAVFPVALLAGFGRVKPMFTIFSHLLAQVPGIPGDYARTAFYFLTLERFSLESRILFGSFFAHPEASVEPYVVINPYCVLGRCQIGARTQVGAMTNILSGKTQHIRDPHGRLREGAFATIRIGPDVWLGASSTVLAHIGEGATIGAGSVVVQDIPAGAVAVGNPARVIRQGESPADS